MQAYESLETYLSQLLLLRLGQRCQVTADNRVGFAWSGLGCVDNKQLSPVVHDVVHTTRLVSLRYRLSFGSYNSRSLLLAARRSLAGPISRTMHLVRLRLSQYQVLRHRPTVTRLRINPRVPWSSGQDGGWLRRQRYACRLS